jgi:hypothetical protein
MNFGFSEEQDELRKMVRRFLEEKSPESEVRRLMATSEGYDPAVWAQMANELALQGLGIPEEFGGQGYGPVELYVVFEEMGAALFCSPYFSTVALAANALLLVGNESDKAKYLPGIASGEMGSFQHFNNSNTFRRRLRRERDSQFRHGWIDGVPRTRTRQDRQGGLALRRRRRRSRSCARVTRHHGPDS